jgi:tetratricopeptide (TPR) repeat protein
MLIRLLRRLVRRDDPHGDGETRRLPPHDNPNHDLAREALQQAVAFLQAGRLEPAETLLQKALGLEHDLAEAHFRMGELHERRGEHEDAADCHELASIPVVFRRITLWPRCASLKGAMTWLRSITRKS